MWRQAAMKVSGKVISSLGTWRRVCCWCGKRAVSSPISVAEISALRGGNSLPGTTRFIANSINWLPQRYGRNIAGDCRIFLLGGGACPHRSIRLKARPRRQASESPFVRFVCIPADTEREKVVEGKGG